jgi:hypothetical protein
LSGTPLSGWRTCKADMAQTPFEDRLKHVAQDLKYPPTPDLRDEVAERIRHASSRLRPTRRWAWGALVLALVAGLITAVVPAARAAFVEILQLGSVRLHLAPAESDLPDRMGTVIDWPPDFAGETTLNQARQRFPYRVRLPASSTGLGAPDRVYAPGKPAASVILIWMSSDGDHPQFGLFELAPSAIYQKETLTVIERTQVGEQLALWTSGPYLVEVENGDLAERRLLEGHVLIWSEGDVTYRIETGGSLQEALAIAESLR